MPFKCAKAKRKSAGLLIRTHIVLVDRVDESKGKISGKTDTFKTCVIDFEQQPMDSKSLLGKYLEVKIKKATTKTLRGTFVEETSIQRFFQRTNGKPYY